MLRHWFVILSTWSHQRSESSTQVAVTIGEIIGHFLNDAIMRITTRRNRGVFEAESRLWWVWSACLSEVWPLIAQLTTATRIHRACYVAVPLYVCGFAVLGVALKDHNSVPAFVMGWGILVAAVMMNTVAVCGSLYVHTPLVKIQGLLYPRCLHQRLLPETPGGD